MVDYSIKQRNNYTFQYKIICTCYLRELQQSDKDLTVEGEHRQKDRML